MILRDSEDYTRSKGKVNVFRFEAIKAGISKAWKENKYDLIVEVAERLPTQSFEEDSQLKLYYDKALNRTRSQLRQGKLL